MCFRTDLVEDFHYFLSLEFNMKKLIIIVAFSLTLLAGCVGWAHWGERDRQGDQRQEQHDDRHNDRH